MSRRRRSDAEDRHVFQGLHKEFARVISRSARDAVRNLGEQRNNNFKQIYPAGFERLCQLVDHAATRGSFAPLRLWLLLAERCGRDNTLISSQAVLAKRLGVSTRTIRRASEELERVGALRRLRCASEYAYCLNPRDMWAGFKDDKERAPYKTGQLGLPRRDGTRERSVRLLLDDEAPRCARSTDQRQLIDGLLAGCAPAPSYEEVDELTLLAFGIGPTDDEKDEAA